MQLSIVIPVYNNVNFTKNAIQDLLNLPNDHEIIIADNASTDETYSVVNGLIGSRTNDNAELTYIDFKSNLGFGKACNEGYKISKGKNVLFLNNDIRVRENKNTWTREIIQLCEQGYLTSANGGVLDNQFNFMRETNKMCDDRNFYLSGWCLAASRNVFDRLILGTDTGPWNEVFFAYFEDDDLTWRAVECGIPLKIVNVPVTHFGKMTSCKLNLPAMYKKSQTILKELWADRLKNL